MYCPKHFQMDPDRYREFIHQFPLALMIHRHELTVTHCPLVYCPDRHQLVGHLASNNPILETLAEDSNLKVIFNGHQGYISAAWYTNPEEVPTWNYSSLEVSGTCRLADKEETLKILTIQNACYEKRVQENWTIDKLPESKRDAMLNVIQGLVINISSWHGKVKMSQNKNSAEKISLLRHIKKRDYWPYSELKDEITHD